MMSAGLPTSPNNTMCGTACLLRLSSVATRESLLKSTPTIVSGCSASAFPRGVLLFTCS